MTGRRTSYRLRRTRARRIDMAAVLHRPETVSGPEPRKRLRGRIKPQQHRISVQKHRANKGQKASRRQIVRQLRLSRLHARLANIRNDTAHKLKTDLTRRFETIVIEDLNVSGRAKNHDVAGAVLDCGFGEIPRQFQAVRGGRVVVARRFLPSTQVCSCCGCLTGAKGREELHLERWICGECGVDHARDANAAINLRKSGTAGAKVTLRGHGASTGMRKHTGTCRGRTETERICAHI